MLQWDGGERESEGKVYHDVRQRERRIDVARCARSKLGGDGFNLSKLRLKLNVSTTTL